MRINLAFLVPLFIAVPASATETVTVSHADLNLASANGQASFERRMETAVETVCSYGSERQLALRAASQKCERAAREAATAKMQVAVQRATAERALAAAASAPKS